MQRTREAGYTNKNITLHQWAAYVFMSDTGTVVHDLI